MQVNPRVIFFDLDETLLVNTLGFGQLLDSIFAEQLNHLGIERKQQFSQSLFDTAGGLWERMLLPGCSGQSLLVETFHCAIEDIDGDGIIAESVVRQFLYLSSRATQLSADAVEVLDALRAKGITTGIITNGIDVLQRSKIELHGLEEKVDAVVISEKAGAHKPDRQVFEYALNLTNATAGNAWHVGDHLVNDISGAIGAGLTGVYYNPGRVTAKGSTGPSAVQDAHHTIHTLMDLLHLLQA